MIVWIRRFPRRIELQEEWDVTRLSFSALGIARYQSQSQFIRQLRTKPKFLYLGGIEMSDETKTCEWKEHSNGGWVGSCKLRWWLDEGTPKQNEMKFCPKCGKSIKQEAAK